LSYPGFIPPHGGYEKLLTYKKSGALGETRPTTPSDPTLE
jgi:hypothetical protein